MKSITGKVSNIERSTKIELNDYSFSSKQLTSFQINKNQILMNTVDPVLINHNDNVSVAGFYLFGSLRGIAYRNITTGAYGYEGFISSLFFGSFFLALGIFSFIFNFINFNTSSDEFIFLMLTISLFSLLFSFLFVVKFFIILFAKLSLKK